jgi:hypothetical protein
MCSAGAASAGAAADVLAAAGCVGARLNFQWLQLAETLGMPA